jgi:hypothetical protein
MGGDFWQGAKLGATVGAISGGVQGIATSEQFGNFMNGNGFRSNASVRAEQIRIANLRDSLTTSKSELVSATRTTQAAESGVADMMGAELMMSNFQGDSGSALQNFALRHVGLKATFNAGLGGIGVSGQVSFTSAGIYGRVGLGPGIGWGATLTTGTSFGSSSGWGITGSLAGGSGYAGGVLSGTISQGGSKLYIGGGLGDFAVGGSASLTGGYEGEIITW